jgi:hypothetical protein
MGQVLNQVSAEVVNKDYIKSVENCQPNNPGKENVLLSLHRVNVSTPWFSGLFV